MTIDYDCDLGQGGDPVVRAKVADDFEGVVVDLLGSHQVWVVCADRLKMQLVLISAISYVDCL